MKIQVLGTGCARCKSLTENTRKAVSDLGLEADVEKIEDIQEIMRFGVMMTPALAIDGDVILCGKVASPEEIKRLLGGAR